MGGEARVGGDRRHWDIAGLSLWVIVAALYANLLYNAVQIQLGAHHPYSWFMFHPEDRFADFFKLLLSLPEGVPAGMDGSYWTALFDHFRDDVERFNGTKFNHFHLPPVSMALALLAQKAAQAVGAVNLFLLLMPLMLALLARTVVRQAAGRKWHWVPIVLLSYPVVYSMDRGHLFALLCSITTIAALAGSVERRPTIGELLLLAVAVNLRPYIALIPIVLWLAGVWRFSDGLKAAGLSGLLFAAALGLAHLLYPAYTLDSFRAGLSDYTAIYGLAGYGQGYGSSFYGGLHAIFGLKAWTVVAPVVLAMALTALAVIARREHRIGTAEWTFLLGVIGVAVTQIFADYHLAFFLLPLALLSREWTGTVSQRALFAATLFVLIPKNYFFTDALPSPWSWQLVANPLALFLASIVVLDQALRRPKAAVGAKLART